MANLNPTSNLVVIHEVITLPDGSVGIGNCYEVEMREAVKMIERDEARAEGFARGVIPGGWAAVEVKNG